MTRPEQDAAGRRSRAIALIALLVVGFALRYAIADRAIWFDERFTLMHTESLSAAVDHCLKDVHPPLYFVLMALWRAAFPSTEFSMRFLSVIFGMASVVGIVLAARAIAGRWAGLAAAAIAALSPYHWLYSTELRPYSLFLAVSAFSTWAFLCVLREGRLRHFLLLAVFSILNLYTHYFAIFLLMAQAAVFVVVVFHDSARGRNSRAPRSKQIIYGCVTLGLIIIAYVPWAAVLRRVVAESVVEGHVVGVGRRAGRGITPDLVVRTVFYSLGQGLVPLVVQGALLVFALLNRKLRGASLFFIMTWALPVILLLIWKPGHFIAPKYFMFAYPLAVAMVAAGLCSFHEFMKRRRAGPTPPVWVLILLVSILPLLPAQHEPYAFHGSDWKTIVAEVTEYAEEGDRTSFPGDSKSYAMVIHYTDEGFFRRHPVILWWAGEGVAPFVSLEGGTDVWFIRRGDLPEAISSGLGGRLETVKTWHIYPVSVSLYHFTAGDTGSELETGGVDDEQS
jgi:uncharacterized membrane protein